MKRLPWVLLFASMAAAIGWLLARPSPDPERVAALERDLLKAESTIQSLRADLAKALENRSAPAPRTAQAGPSSGNPADGAQPATPAPAKKPGAAWREMMEQPGMRDAVRQQQKTTLNMQYAGLFKRFDLTPEEKAHFEKLLLDRKMADVDLGLAIAKEGVTREQRDALVKKHQEDKKASDEAIRQFLNDEGDYAAYQEWEDSSPERLQLEMFGRGLFNATDHPLNEDQENMLVQAMVEARKTPRPPGTPPAPSPTDDPVAGYTAERVDEIIAAQSHTQQLVLDKAAAFLTPEQVETLRQFQEQQLSMMETGMRMSSMMLGTDGDK